MRTHLVRLVCLFLIITSACQASENVLPTPSPNPIVATTPTVLSDLSGGSWPTSTSVVESPTQGDCLPISTDLPISPKSNGFLYLRDQHQQIYLLLDMKSFKKQNLSPLQEKWEGDLQLTQNGVSLAHDTKKSLVVTQADGTEVTSIPYDWENQRFHWLNNMELLIYNSTETGLRIPGLALNPVTGQKRKISRDYPNVFWEVSDWNSWAYSFDSELFRFSPDLRYVIYPLDPQSGQTGFAVTDVNKHEMIAHLPNPDLTSLPVWSPDGSSFVFANRPPGDWDGIQTMISDVMLGKPNGEFSTLIKMSDYFTTGLVLPQSFYWSPNGRYILFSTFDVKNNGWMLVDVSSQEVMRLCVEGTTGYGYVAWAPDSQSVAVASNIDLPMFLIDLIDKKVTQFDNLTPTGWLSKEK